MMNISFTSTIDSSSSVHGIKRPREEEPPHSETNKKIKTATKNLFITLDKEVIKNEILSHLDVISLVRFSETAWKYKSLIDSDKYLSLNILFEKIYSFISNFAKRIPNNDRMTNCFFLHLNAYIACTLIRANHSKAIEVFLKEINEMPRYVKICRIDVLRVRLRLFEALALAKHPIAEKFIPPVNDYQDSNLLFENLLFDYAASLVKSKLPKASLLFQRVIDLAEDQSTFKEVEWLSMMAKLKHPKTGEFLLRAIDNAEKEGNYRFLAEQMIEIKDPRAIKFAELAIRTSRSRLSTIVSLAKVSIKSKHAKASGFLERAIHLFEQEILEDQLYHLKDLSLIMVPVNPPKAIELFQQYQDHLDDECLLERIGDACLLERIGDECLLERMCNLYFNSKIMYKLFDRSGYQSGDEDLIKHDTLCKMCKALAMANHQRTGEFFQSAIESANQMKREQDKIIAFCKIAEAMAVKNPSEVFNMMQHTINILGNPLPTNSFHRNFQTLFQTLFPHSPVIQQKQDLFVFKNIAWTFAKILFQVGDQLHKMKEAKSKR